MYLNILCAANFFVLFIRLTSAKSMCCRAPGVELFCIRTGGIIVLVGLNVYTLVWCVCFCNQNNKPANIRLRQDTNLWKHLSFCHISNIKVLMTYFRDSLLVLLMVREKIMSLQRFPLKTVYFQQKSIECHSLASWKEQRITTLNRDWHPCSRLNAGVFEILNIQNRYFFLILFSKWSFMAHSIL